MEEWHADARGWLDESRAYALARRIARTPGYRVLNVRRAWSAAVAWQVEAEDRRTGEYLLLLSENTFDSRLTRAGQLVTGEITTAHAAHIHERAAAHHSSPRAQAHATNVEPGPRPGQTLYQRTDHHDP